MFLKRAKANIIKVGKMTDFEKDMRALGVSGEKTDGMMEKLASFRPIAKYLDDFIYTRQRAISALEYHGHNINFDAFREEDLIPATPTFIATGFYKDHVNWDPKFAYGINLDARYNHEGHFVEVISAVSKSMQPDSPIVQANIREGVWSETSMGAQVGESECSICGNRATMPSQFCEHILYHKGSKIGGKDVFEINHDLCFFDDSIITTQAADRDALITEILEPVTASSKDNPVFAAIKHPSRGNAVTSEAIELLTKINPHLWDDPRSAKIKQADADLVMSSSLDPVLKGVLANKILTSSASDAQDFCTNILVAAMEGNASAAKLKENEMSKDVKQANIPQANIAEVEPKDQPLGNDGEVKEFIKQDEINPAKDPLPQGEVEKIATTVATKIADAIAKSLGENGKIKAQADVKLVPTTPLLETLSALASAKTTLAKVRLQVRAAALDLKLSKPVTEAACGTKKKKQQKLAEFAGDLDGAIVEIEKLEDNVEDNLDKEQLPEEVIETIQDEVKDAVEELAENIEEKLQDEGLDIEVEVEEPKDEEHTEEHPEDCDCPECVDAKEDVAEKVEEDKDDETKED